MESFHTSNCDISLTNKMTNFESLPDDIFLDVFDYFDGTDLFHIFYGLNSRFNRLLYQEYYRFRFNFVSISKRKFDKICQEHLPLITDRVISLCLSDDNDTPRQIGLFFTYIPSLEQFTNLRALLLNKINTWNTLLVIIEQCYELSHLTHFQLNYDYIFGMPTFSSLVTNSIWSLPKLSHCDFNSTVNWAGFCNTPTKISSSIECLSLSKKMFALNEINDLYEHTPNLKYLSIKIDESIIAPMFRSFLMGKTFTDAYIPCLLPTLINLNICVYSLSNISQIVSLLQNVPNLRVLHIDLQSNMISGYQWEHIIGNYLLKLKKFQLKMAENFSSRQHIKERMNELIDPFRSIFWTDEHQWFVRCFDCDTTVYLYTVPYTLSSHANIFPDTFLSTDPNDSLQRFSNGITEILQKTFFDQQIPSDIRFSNLQDLYINFPIHNQFWLIVPHLNRLNSLTVYVNANTSQSQLQTLLDRTPNLYKLTLCDQELTSKQPLKPIQRWHIELLNCKNTSVRSLNLNRFACCSNNEECIIVAHSSLGAQCEALSIQINNYEDIVSLINNMINLRILQIYWKRDVYFNNSSSLQSTVEANNNSINLNETIEWLTERLPSKCSTRFLTPESTSIYIYIWIVS